MGLHGSSSRRYEVAKSKKTLSLMHRFVVLASAFVVVEVGLTLHVSVFLNILVAVFLFVAWPSARPSF